MQYHVKVDDFGQLNNDDYGLIAQLSGRATIHTNYGVVNGDGENLVQGDIVAYGLFSIVNGIGVFTVQEIERKKHSWNSEVQITVVKAA